MIYNGPWKQVVDDDGHLLRRGERTAVCRKTFEIYTREPYAAQVSAIPPLAAVPEGQAGAFACSGHAVRDPRVTKAGAARPDATPCAASCCEPAGERC